MCLPSFRGVIAGCHEVLRRQGLLAGRWCLDPAEDLSPGQAEEIDRLIAALTESGADIVVGSRFIEGGGYRAPFGRRFGIAVFARIVSLVTGLRMTDTTSGFRASGRRAISLFAAAYPHDYPEVEAVIIAHRAGLRLIEVPVQMRERQGGRSSITPIKSGYYMLKVIMAIVMVLLRRPIKLDQPPGA